MSKKDSNFFEKHIEKLVLAAVLVICIVLSYFFVIRSPNTVRYDNRNLSPGEIDNYISRQAADLENKLNRNPEPSPPYEPRVDDFKALLDSAISNIDTRLYIPVPYSSGSEEDDRVYRLPKVGQINEVLAEHIRAVAYVPKGEGGEYTSDNSEPNDIDFITVEAKFDVSELYRRFYESFAGENVQRDWRDPCLARPVFANVHLQRRELLSDGVWSDWQTIPRSKIDSNKRMFEIIEEVGDLPFGGIKVRLLQFSDPGVRMDLLQPDAYQIASAKEEWFPPSLHVKYVEYQKERDIIERREATAGRRDDREEGRSERRSRVTARQEGAEGGGEGYPGGSSTTGRRTTRRIRPDRKEGEQPQRGREVSRTIDDIYQELKDVSITERTDLTRMDGPLLFWAHDDTVEPGKSYQYRIRLGVFNPIAGTNQFREQDKSLKNKVVLWSEFSDTTETINIPGMLYFFPREIQEAVKTVTVQVSRYVLGYWYSQDFTVKQGELIGKIGDYRITDDEVTRGVTVPKMVDYTTGAVVVDVVPVNDWSGGNSLRSRRFFDMLYSVDGKDIKRLPIRTRYWADALQNKFNEIKRSERETKEPLRPWQSKAGQRGGRTAVPVGGERLPPGYRD